MVAKLCSQCGTPADFSVCYLLSTIGRAKRQQKCTASVPFCGLCFRRLLSQLATAAPASLVRPLSAAYTAMAGHSDAAFNHSFPDKETA